ncbi:hypothetical protein PP938_gp142 [Rhizobium phage AF3]|uniref:Transmembrane protein n=1 Tax=Rhizobium phage AF3 TaxID=2763529 RepID=A0A7G7WWM4_9CAUD|nr:hypothetical protein PP938_gp142 [Rhizobium phage AF3]QNH71618.1 hypothetical protein AF3_142 [Rhizobium phage AF3]
MSDQVITGIVFVVGLIGIFWFIHWFDERQNAKDDYCSWR